ncbi:MAG: hypothetical protein DRO99_03135 [Candidatus Aenigmatarchaeota archaeon]|mgnify:CR=1 FL=1|nr:MAG: hypothetical protein DRO99_03135 [Candidatus Aenigmarchaeota archaeon]
MEQHEAISLVFVAAIVTLSLAATMLIAAKYGTPVGWDYKHHVVMATKYARGSFDLSPTSIGTNFGIYPPLFHIMLAFFIISGTLGAASLFMQVAFYPLIMLSGMFLVWKTLGERQAAIAGIIMLGSVALFDRSQVIPQSLDMIFIPLGMYLFLKKDKLSLICLSIPMYAHGPFAFPLLGAMLLFSRKHKPYRELAKWALAISLPIIALVALTLPSYASFSSGYNNPQERIMTENPLYMILYMGPIPVVLLPISLIAAGRRWRGLSGIETMSVYWIALLCPLLLVMADRFASYAVVPTAVLASSWLSGKARKKWLLVMLVLLFWIAMTTSYIPMLRIISGWNGYAMDAF